jgi:hypothetical protein
MTDEGMSLVDRRTIGQTELWVRGVRAGRRRLPRAVRGLVDEVAHPSCLAERQLLG